MRVVEEQITRKQLTIQRFCMVLSQLIRSRTTEFPTRRPQFSHTKSEITARLVVWRNECVQTPALHMHTYYTQTPTYMGAHLFSVSKCVRVSVKFCCATRDVAALLLNNLGRCVLEHAFVLVLSVWLPCASVHDRNVRALRDCVRVAQRTRQSQ